MSVMNSTAIFNTHQLISSKNIPLPLPTIPVNQWNPFQADPLSLAIPYLPVSLDSSFTDLTTSTSPAAEFPLPKATWDDVLQLAVQLLAQVTWMLSGNTGLNPLQTNTSTIQNQEANTEISSRLQAIPGI